MPELPEAESVARALNRSLRMKKITSVEVYAPKLRTPLTPLKTAGLVGRTFVGCRRRARYAVADLDDGRTLTMHFGMRGVVRVEDAAKPRRKHQHAVMRHSDGRAFARVRPNLWHGSPHTVRLSDGTEIKHDYGSIWRDTGCHGQEYNRNFDGTFTKVK